MDTKFGQQVDLLEMCPEGTHPQGLVTTLSHGYNTFYQILIHPVPEGTYALRLPLSISH